MAKPDWGELQNQFLVEHASTGISPKDWCDTQGLNYESARRYIKKPTAHKEKNAQKYAQKKLRIAQPKERAKKSISQVENQIDSTRSVIENTNDEWTLNPDEYGLTDMQARFVNEYLIDMDKTAAYKRAGYKSEGETAAASARRLYRNVSVNQAIRDALDARERRTQITQDDVLKMWWEIATADANQITELRRLCCRHCWGFGFQYQWQDAVEFEEARDRAKQSKKPEPKDNGGYGFDAQLDPNPECPRCNGMGVSRSHFHDTRDLRGAARRLYAGVKEGKFGLEVLMRNQDDALKMVAQHLGMLKNKTEISGPDGGPVQTETANLSPQEAADAYKKLMG
ncbi:terminase small subunit [Pectobacterium brasiliense]|uniref:terminase small subunit n=1 Tax=Pectobacterium brasiliense TaxID=180957 RepID=UPI0030185DED